MLAKLQSDVEIRGGAVCEFYFRRFKLTVGRVMKLFECTLSDLGVGDKDKIAMCVILYLNNNIQCL